MTIRTRTTDGITDPLIWPPNWGPAYLTEGEFNELESIQLGLVHVEPTKSIKEAAKMIRRLYGKKK